MAGYAEELAPQKQDIYPLPLSREAGARAVAQEVDLKQGPAAAYMAAVATGNIDAARELRAGLTSQEATTALDAATREGQTLSMPPFAETPGVVALGGAES